MDVKKEALRYLGYGSSKPDEATERLLTRAISELRSCGSEKYCYKVLQKKDCGSILRGEDIIRHLEGCEKVILFAATVCAEIIIFVRVCRISPSCSTETMGTVCS